MSVVTERLEKMWLLKLRRLVCYPEIVKRLTNHESIHSVTRWLERSNAGGRHLCSESWRRYVTVLKREIEKARPKVLEVEQQATVADIKEVQNIIEEEVAEMPLSPQGLALFKQVQKAMKTLHAENMLKFSFVIQQQRVQRLLNMENVTGVLARDGYKEIETLANLSAQVLRFELGNLAILRGTKNGPPPYDAVYESQGQSDLASRVSKLSEADRNLLIAASSKVYDMIEAEAQSERTENQGLASDASGAEDSAGEAGEGFSEPDGSGR